MNQLRKEAEKQGWEVKLTSSGHVCWASPSGFKVFSAQTPSDPRAIKNHKSLLKKHGFTVELHRKKTK
jgi:hypothetical protein